MTNMSDPTGSQGMQIEPAKDPSNRERRRERTRVMILHAAEELLAEGGLQNVTLANIADRAAYSKPAIYEYFVGLEDIMMELSNAGFVRLGQTVKAVPDSLSADERLLAVVHAILRFAGENAELYQLMFSHIIFSNNGQDQRYQDMLKDTQTAYRVASEIIQEGIEQGIFKTRPGFEGDEMLYMCWVIVHGMASLKHTLTEELGLDVLRYQAQTLDALLHSLKGTLPGGND
jgi:AcrR family transcriptional regulator